MDDILLLISGMKVLTAEATYYFDQPGEWVIDGIVNYSHLHRVDGPAYEGADGTMEWYLHGKCHREDGPARIGLYGSKYWFSHGELHREDGPAIEYMNGDKHWYIHGKRIRVEHADTKIPYRKLTKET